MSTTAKADPYVVVLAPEEFHEVWESLHGELEHLGSDDPAHAEVIGRVLAKLEAAERAHDCVDERG